MNTWRRDAQLPMPTVVVLAVLALIPWLNAIFNRYRFNLVLALLATVPVAVVLVRGVLTARATHNSPAGAAAGVDPVPSQSGSAAT